MIEVKISGPEQHEMAYRYFHEQAEAIRKQKVEKIENLHKDRPRQLEALRKERADFNDPEGYFFEMHGTNWKKEIFTEDHDDHEYMEYYDSLDALERGIEAIRRMLLDIKNRIRLSSTLFSCQDFDSVSKGNYDCSITTNSNNPAESGSKVIINMPEENYLDRFKGLWPDFAQSRYLDINGIDVDPLQIIKQSDFPDLEELLSNRDNKSNVGIQAVEHRLFKGFSLTFHNNIESILSYDGDELNEEEFEGLNQINAIKKIVKEYANKVVSNLDYAIWVILDTESDEIQRLENKRRKMIRIMGEERYVRKEKRIFAEKTSG